MTFRKPHMIQLAAQLASCFPVWDGYARPGRAWRLAYSETPNTTTWNYRDIEYIREEPSDRAPAGYPVAFATPQIAHQFREDCIQKLVKWGELKQVQA